jgi:cytochrome c553
VRRSAPLRSSPVTARAWRDRSRERAIERAREAAAKREQRRRRREARDFPGATGWTGRVFCLYGRSCVVCGEEAVQGHHAVPRQRILADTRKTRDERRELAYDARNGVPICGRCHERHEIGAERIPRKRLPAGVIEWARERGFAHVLKAPVYP